VDHRHRNESFGPIGATLKKAAHALRSADVPFLLGGSVAAWVTTLTRSRALDLLRARRRRSDRRSPR